MKIAIIGGGIFGCTTAIYAARAGYDVHLYEQDTGLLRAATGLNQFRFHAGYHYPRSLETAREASEGIQSFSDEYGQALVHDHLHLYAIAREGSKVRPDEYLRFCHRAGLRFDIMPTRDWINPDSVELVIQAREKNIDPTILRGLVWDGIEDAGVRVHMGAKATAKLRNDYDKIIIAGYVATNDICRDLKCETQEFQFEVCEKPVLKMPDEFEGVGVVVMDGPFCCVDPLGKSGYHVMGHVEHAIHSRNVGEKPEIPHDLRDHVNNGVITKPEKTRIYDFKKAGRDYIPLLDRAEHMGSMFTVRAVLPDRDATDERPTLVHELDDQIIRIFSGKIGCAVTAAQSVLQMLETIPRRMDDRVLEVA